ncbi:MAG: translocation/assembly module TamB domain-containing protein, partial [Longimicrobiales bacterium]
ADGVYAARRRDVEARVTGEVLLGGRYTRPELSGELRIDQGALYIEELYRQYLLSGVELDDPTLLALVDTSLVAVRPFIAASQNPFMKNLRVRDMRVNVGADSWLRSRDMDVEVSGSVTVAFRAADLPQDRRDEDLRLTGSLDVGRGTYTLYYPPLQSRRFQVRQGSINFPGTPGMDPNLAITAAYKARARGEPLDVLAIVSGTLQNPRVRLSSEVQPPISESDLASYLFFGVPTWEVANTGSGQQSRTMAGLGGALTPSVLGYASSGLQTLVQNAGLLDYVGFTTTESGVNRETDTGLSDFLAETQLEIGRYLTSDVYFGMSKRLGTSNLDAGARLEWRFLPEYSFELFAEDRLARAPAFGLRQETGLRKVYGFLLFREWGF